MKTGLNLLSSAALCSLLALSQPIKAEGYFGVCADHVSQIPKTDYGVTVAGVCLQECRNPLCITGKLVTPIGHNDMKYDWTTGDWVGGIELTARFWRW